MRWVQVQGVVCGRGRDESERQAGALHRQGMGEAFVRCVFWAPFQIKRVLWML